MAGTQSFTKHCQKTLVLHQRDLRARRVNTVAVCLHWPSRGAVFEINVLRTPPMRTQSAVRPRIASRTRETRSKYATRRRRQTSSAPATGTATGVDNGGLFAAESANVCRS